MTLPSLADIAKSLSIEDIERLVALKRAGPKLEKLEARQRKLTDELADVDQQIAALEGDKAPVKRGRPPKATSVPTKRGRPPTTAAPPAKRGRGRPPKAKPAAKVGRPRGRPDKAGSKREAMLARMAKMRAARTAKREAAAEAKAYGAELL